MGVLQSTWPLVLLLPSLAARGFQSLFLPLVCSCCRASAFYLAAVEHFQSTLVKAVLMKLIRKNVSKVSSASWTKHYYQRGGNWRLHLAMLVCIKQVNPAYQPPVSLKSLNSRAYHSSESCSVHSQNNFS